MIDTNHSLRKLEQSVVDIIINDGPITGAQLQDALPDAQPIALWKVSYQSSLLRLNNFARYYLRYDVTRANQLRLSPSILRDFRTYTLIFHRLKRSQAFEQSVRLANKHRLISRHKISIARQAIMSIDSDILQKLVDHACFFISGDVSYFLAHDVPRIHPQYETQIKGSDIDILIVFNNELDAGTIKKAEDQMLKFKARALRDPAIGEEIDFLFKPVAKMMGQMQYRDIHEKIASKVLYESMFLYGRLDIYEFLQRQLELSGGNDKIEADFETALSERKQTVSKILALSDDSNLADDPQVQSLFYFSQERLEFQ